MKKSNNEKTLQSLGLVITYIGKGKGKTTAAMGLAARAAGSGLKVRIIQFVKAQKPKKGQKLQRGEWPVSSEVIFFENSKPKKDSEIGSVVCEQVGAGFVGILGDSKERSAHVAEAERGLELVKKELSQKLYQVFVLDEILSAVDLKLLTVQSVLDLIQNRPPGAHIVLTGHKSYKKITDASDTVTEMKMIKHPFYKGQLAKRGIDY